MKQFILDHFERCDNGWIEITLLDDATKRQAPRVAWIPRGKLESELDNVLDRARERNAQGWGVYLGACTRSHKSAEGKRGKKCDCALLPALWADLDCGYDKIDVAYRALASFTHPPTVIVATGGGVQAWWRFEQPIDITGNWTSAERIMRGLARSQLGEIAADPAVADVARIMRIPGFKNMKPDRGEFEAAILLDDGPLYNPFAFACYAETAEPSSKRYMPQYTRSNGRVLTYRARDFLANGASQGTRHASLLHTVYQMHDKGYDRSDCEQQAGGAAVKCGLGDREITNVINHVYGGE